jgi:hypothetical protein
MKKKYPMSILNRLASLQNRRDEAPNAWKTFQAAV